MAPPKSKPVKLSLQEMLSQGQPDGSLMTTTYSSGVPRADRSTGDRTDGEWTRGGGDRFGERRVGGPSSGFSSSDTTDVWRKGGGPAGGSGGPGGAGPMRESNFGRGLGGDEDFTREGMQSRQNLVVSERGSGGFGSSGGGGRYDSTRSSRPVNDDVDFGDVRVAPRSNLSASRSAMSSTTGGVSRSGFSSATGFGASSGFDKFDRVRSTDMPRLSEGKTSEPGKYRPRAPGSQPASAITASAEVEFARKPITSVRTGSVASTSPKPAPTSFVKETPAPFAASVKQTTSSEASSPETPAKALPTPATSSAAMTYAEAAAASSTGSSGKYVPPRRKEMLRSGETGGTGSFASFLKQKQVEQLATEPISKPVAPVPEENAKTRHKKMMQEREQKKREKEERRRLEKIETEKLELIALEKLMVADRAKTKQLEDVLTEGLRRRTDATAFLSIVKKNLSSEDLESLVPSIVIAKCLAVCSLEALRPMVETADGRSSATDNDRMAVVRDLVKCLRATLKFIFQSSNIKMHKLQFLKETQKFFHAMQFPRVSAGLCLVEAVWDALYIEDVIEEQYFTEWYSNADDDTPGRTQVMFQMLAWFSWLNSAPAEGEEISLDNHGSATAAVADSDEEDYEV